MSKLNQPINVMTPIFAFGMAMMVSAPTISAEMQSYESPSFKPLVIAAGEQPEAVEGAFKRQDPDSIIRNTATPDENAPNPDPDVKSESFKKQDSTSTDSDPMDSDTLIREETNTSTMDASESKSVAEPEGFKSKEQTGLENLKK